MVYRDFLFYLEKVGYGQEGRKLIAAAVREFLAWKEAGKASREKRKTAKEKEI